MKNLQLLKGAKNVEVVAFREHPYRKGKDVLKHITYIKNYDSIAYDDENKCLLFLKSEDGIAKIVDRLAGESIIKINQNYLGDPIVLVD